jgi:hypothetical protein
MRPIGPGLRDAMRPLVAALRTLSPADRRAWLDELRGDAPVLAEVLERVENEAGADEAAAPDAPPPPSARLHQ